MTQITAINRRLSCCLMTLTSMIVIAAGGPAVVEGQVATQKPQVHKASPIDINQIPRVELATIDVNSVLAEDVNRSQQGLAPRFAIPHPVQMTPVTDGIWQTLADGSRRWQLRISAPGAVSINLGFVHYLMPDGGQLVLRAADNSRRIRPFTAADNADHGQLWTPPLATDDMIVEVTLPNANAENGLDLELSSINYGYRDFGSIVAAAGVTPRSGACNVDVVCPQGDPWRNEIPAIAVYSTGGSLFCTGSMINNTAGDQTPYFLTANHCGINSGNAASLVVFWNFETSTCGGAPNGTLNQFQSGSTWRAGYAPSDFTLVELSQSPNPAWNISFAGWDRSLADPNSAVCIHHPNTDEKRISFDNNPSVTTSWGGTAVPGDGTHVRILDWDLGTTEPGSSGSPLFDQNHHIVGQLHGGQAACGNNLSDWFGRLSKSWTGGGNASSRLSDWLDAANTGAVSVNTLAPAGSVCGNGIVEPGEQCDPPGPGCDANCQFNFPDCNNNNRDDAQDIACGAGNVCNGIPGSADCNLNGIPDECEGTVTTTFSVPVSPPLAIPDGNGTFVSHTFNVPDNGIISDLNVGITITHTWNGDLIVRLTHNATTVVLIDRPGLPASGSGFSDDGYNIVLDDEGSGGSIENASTGGPAVTSPPSYVPNNPLSAFDGMDRNGTWLIEVSDNAAQDTGTLDSWSLEASQAGAVQCVGACCLADGTCSGAVTAAQCTTLGGTYQGDGTDCANVQCPQPTGACCHTDGTCQVLTQADCGLSPGAIYQGDGTTCTPNPCPQPCPGPADGDLNGDLATDGSDIQVMVDAMLGAPTQNEICHGDFNGSGGLDNGDLTGMVSALLAP